MPLSAAVSVVMRSEFAGRDSGAVLRVALERDAMHTGQLKFALVRRAAPARRPVAFVLIRALLPVGV
jgi:hypothetical protein